MEAVVAEKTSNPKPKSNNFPNYSNLIMEFESLMGALTSVSWTLLCISL